jgi:ribosomal protein L11 methylase PrmA
LKEYSNPINIIDVGCGTGIFSIIALLNNDIQVNELVLTDIENNCLYSALQNLTYNKNLFNIRKLTIIKSDILNDLKSSYYNYFDIVLANMPQTPSKVPIRSNII